MEIESIIQKYAMSVYTVSWVSGSAKDFAEGTDTLSSFLQDEATAVNGLTVSKAGTVTGNQQTITGGGHIHNGKAGTEEGNRGGSYSAVPVGVMGITGGEHSHTFTPSITDTISVSLTSNDTETRPMNYTVRIWKRIA